MSISLKIIVIIFFSIYANVAISQIGDQGLYGLKRNSGQFYLAKLDLVTGTSQNISTTSVTNVVANAWGTVNPITNSYFFTNNTHILEVDLSTGNVVSFILAPDFHFLDFNCNDSTLYGLRRDSGQWYLAKLDLVTGTSQDISLNPVTNVIASSWGAVNPITNSYFFSNGTHILEVDLSTGNVISFILTPDFHWLDFNYCCCSDINTPITEVPSEIPNEIPNVFTPNGDLINDFFLIMQSEKISEFNINIYNRWGNLIFQSTNTDFKWDGKFNGTECSEGTYFWVLNYTLEEDKIETKQGTVTLLR